MTNDSNTLSASDQGHEPGDGSDEIDALWEHITKELRMCIDGLSMCEQGDYLRLELIGPASDSCEADAYPYLQISATGETSGHVSVEIPGNFFLGSLYELNEEQCASLRRMGWEGNEPMTGRRNWIWEIYDEHHVYDEVAEQLVTILRDYFGVAHPEMLTLRQVGLIPDLDEKLGLTETTKVPIEKPTSKGGLDEAEGHRSGVAYATESREELIPVVGEVLADLIDDEPEVDDDGDFVIRHMDQVVWVRVLRHQPGVEILARVAHGVRSREQAAVEVGILNRDTGWVVWTLRDRDIWQQALIPAQPFAPLHLKGMLNVFLHAMAANRDDLALRTGAETG